MIDRSDIIKEIKDSLNLKDDWDGEGAIKPREECVKQALEFLEEMPYEFPLPDFMVHVNGTVGFFWNEKGENEFYIDVEILGDGRIAYFMKGEGTKEKGVTTLPGKKNGRDADTKTEKKGGDKKEHTKE